jgi:hypothetical protein
MLDCAAHGTHGNAVLTERACGSRIVTVTTHSERIAMTYESYKAWLDEMPIDDVRRRIERLEKKLWDLHVLERLYDERRSSGEDAAAAGESGEPGEAQVEGEPGEPAETGEPSEGHEHGEQQSEPSYEHGEEHAGG